MRSVAGVLTRPALGGAAHRDDDIVACVHWQGGRAFSSCAPCLTGNQRVGDWIARELRTVCAEDPWAVMTRRELTRPG
jgi:hypothetical protein